MDKPQIGMSLFQFMCPECGMSDAELGHLAAANDIHCSVCLIDDDRYVRLRRWVAEEPTSPVVDGAPLSPP